MKIIAVVCLFFFITLIAVPATHFVAHDGLSIYPYITKENAATNIQDAVDAAIDGETVIVAAGIYSNGNRITPDFTLSNRLVIAKAITVQSEEGADKTFIVGAGPDGENAIRCVFMTNGASLIGFTLSNGHTRTTASVLPEYFYNKSGGGVFMVDGCYVSNCVFINNSADHSGGGLFCYSGGTVDCSRFTYNTSGSGGGVTFYSGHSLLNNSIIIENNAVYAGGGVNIDNADDMSKCFISKNSANNGGGVFLKSFGLVDACTISNNFARNFGGGVFIDNLGGHNYLNSCLIIDNIATNKGGGLYQYQFGYCLNCTIARNYAGDSGGGVFNYLGGAVYNSIIYYNNAPIDDNYSYILGYPPYSYCCTTPWTNDVAYNVITNNPDFADINANNFRLNEWSVCINTGYNGYVDYNAIDLDGNTRIYDGTVDLGCYELVPEPMCFRFIGLLAIYYIIKFNSQIRQQNHRTRK